MNPNVVSPKGAPRRASVFMLFATTSLAAIATLLFMAHPAGAQDDIEPPLPEKSGEAGEDSSVAAAGNRAGKETSSAPNVTAADYDAAIERAREWQAYAQRLEAENQKLKQENQALRAQTNLLDQRIRQGQPLTSSMSTSDQAAQAMAVPPQVGLVGQNAAIEEREIEIPLRKNVNLQGYGGPSVKVQIVDYSLSRAKLAVGAESLRDLPLSDYYTLIYRDQISGHEVYIIRGVASSGNAGLLLRRPKG